MAADERDDIAGDRRACRDLQTQWGRKDDSLRETRNFKVFRTGNILGDLSTNNAHDLTNDLMRIKIFKNKFNLNRQSQSASRICKSMSNLSTRKWNQWRLSDLHPQSLIELIMWSTDLRRKHWGHEHLLKSTPEDAGLTGCCAGTLSLVRATWQGLINRHGKPGREQEWLMTRVWLLI